MLRRLSTSAARFSYATLAVGVGQVHQAARWCATTEGSPTSTDDRVTAKSIEERLRNSDLLNKPEVTVEDVSGGCGSFFKISVKSAAFGSGGKANLPLIKQHRMINDVLKDEIRQIHGLTISTKPQD